MHPHRESHDLDNHRRMETLAVFLTTTTDKIRQSTGTLYGFPAFFYGNDEAYLVLTDAEALLAAKSAVEEKLWFICLETMFAYFDIPSYPPDVLKSMKIQEIRDANSEIKKLVEHSCGIEALKKKLIEHGNCRNLLADYDQIEHKVGDFYIYRLY